VDEDTSTKLDDESESRCGPLSALTDTRAPPPPTPTPVRTSISIRSSFVALVSPPVRPSVRRSLLPRLLSPQLKPAEANA
jgi:hypothetical protein